MVETYEGDPHVDHAVCKEIVEESALGWHHVWITFALLPCSLLVAEPRPGVCPEPGSATTVRGGSEGIGLLQYARLVSFGRHVGSIVPHRLWIAERAW